MAGWAWLRLLSVALSTARDFLNTLNHAQPAIKFTMEVENDGMLPLLPSFILRVYESLQLALCMA